MISDLELIELYNRPYGSAEGSVLVLVTWASHDLIVITQLKLAPNNNSAIQTYNSSIIDLLQI